MLARLRAAGFAPVPEDASSVAIVAEWGGGPASTKAGLRDAYAARGAGAELDAVEVVLLADALDHGRDVRIAYRNKEGHRTVRAIQPRELYGRWVSSWCHLRSAERSSRWRGSSRSDRWGEGWPSR